MKRLIRAFAALIFALTISSAAAAEPGFQSFSLLFSETWTGNAYHLTYDVTGSEGMPIDMSVGGGARFNLVDPFLSESGALTIDPRLVIGARRYLLYQSEWVVPTQQETSLGADENLVPGFGSARVLTFSVVAIVSWFSLLIYRRGFMPIHRIFPHTISDSSIMRKAEL